VGGTVPVGPETDPAIEMLANSDVVGALAVAVMIVGNRALEAMVTEIGVVGTVL
jgi:hypothetical protein